MGCIYTIYSSDVYILCCCKITFCCFYEVGEVEVFVRILTVSPGCEHAALQSLLVVGVFEQRVVQTLVYL